MYGYKLRQNYHPPVDYQTLSAHIAHVQQFTAWRGRAKNEVTKVDDKLLSLFVLIDSCDVNMFIGWNEEKRMDVG